MAPIFRRQAAHNAESQPAATSSTSRKRSSADGSVHSLALPNKDVDEGKKGGLIPKSLDLLHHLPTSRSKQTSSHTSTSASASQLSVRDRADDQGDARSIRSQSSWTPRQNRSGSISSRPEGFTNIDDHPSPKSESASLPGDKNKGVRRPSVGAGADNHNQETETDTEDDFDRLQMSPSRAKILAKRLGEENPYVLPHPSRLDATSTQYPGVVIGQFASGQSGSGQLGFDVNTIGFDGSINDILDPSAAGKDYNRQGATSGPPAPNIAPWLTDDATPGSTPPLTPSGEGVPTYSPSRDHGLPRKASVPGFTPITSFPKMRRNQTSESANELGVQVRRQDSSSYFPSNNASSDPRNPSRTASSESVATVSVPRLTPADDVPGPLQYFPGGGRHPSGSSSTKTRHSSSATVSSTSTTGDKKKSFLGGFLKRRTGQSMSQSGGFSKVRW